MQRTAVVLLSLFFAFTAAQITTVAPVSSTTNYNQQMLNFINSLTTNPGGTNPNTLPGSQTPSNAQLLDFVTSFGANSNTGTPNTNPVSTNPAGSTTSGALTTNELLNLLQSSSGGSPSNPNAATSQTTAGNTNPFSNLLNNPMMLAFSLRSDALRKMLGMSLLGNTGQPGSMASQMSLMRGSLGDYAQSRLMDYAISQMATATGMDPTMLSFFMPEMPDNYARNNLIGSLLRQQGSAGGGLSGTGSGMLNTNSLFPLFFLRN